MQDTTGLDREVFTDKLDIGQNKPRFDNSRKRKKVNFLDKFGDLGPIDENERWDISENEFMVPEKKYIRTI